MFRPFFAFVGYRYTRVKRKNHFISFISLTSVLGIALGVGVLIAVLSVMNGFNREIRVQILSGTPHITVEGRGGRLFEWKGLLRTLKLEPGVKGAAPFIYSEGMISSLNSGQKKGVMVRGIDASQINEVFPLSSHMRQGVLENLKPGEFGVLVGRPLANLFSLSVGDKITLITSEATLTPAGLSPRIKRFSVVGIFEVGNLYDERQVFIDLQDAEKLFRMQGAVSGIQLKVQNELEAPIIAKDLNRKLLGNYWVVDWTQNFGNFFKALEIQKIAMAFILLLIIAVAAFNLVSSLVMMVTDKRSDIAILRTLGASRRSVMGIFIAQGSIIGMIGTLLGVIFGLFLALHVTEWVDRIQAYFNVELISKEVYLIGYLPSEVHTEDVIIIIVTAFVMSLVATLYPAYRAANVQPAEALRYE